MNSTGRECMSSFSQIMTISRRLQYRLLAEHGKGGDTGFTMVDELKRGRCGLSTREWRGACSHRAALQYLGKMLMYTMFRSLRMP